MAIAIPWKTWGAVLAVLLAGAFFWNRQHRAYVSALREAEDAKLTLRNQIVEHEATRRQLQGSVDDLLKDNAELNAAFNAAMEASPGASPASVSRLDTGPLTVQKAPGVVVAPAAAKSAAPAAAPTPPVPCAVTYDDRLSVAIEEIELTTKRGNTLIVGTAMVYVETPARQLLVSGRFRSELSNTATLEAPSPPRWGAEVAGLCTRDGCGLGAGLLLPPASFLGLRWESRVTAYAGPALALAGGLGARW